METIIRSVTAAIVIFALSFHSAHAATIHVPADHPTIQGCIDAAADGDTCLVSPGTYMENIDFLGKAITVLGEEGADVSILDGKRSGSVVTFVGGESGEAILEGFTIRNGEAVMGGGIKCAGSSPTITGCTIKGSSARIGAGISSHRSGPAITDCSISDNTGERHGGGIYVYESDTVTIANCTISGNTAYVYGGGIHLYRSSPTITSCSISGNTALAYGGGVASEYGAPMIQSTTISQNSRSGLYCYDSDMMIVNCMILGNTAGAGGGIYCLLSSPIITHCTFSENTADRWAGGIYCEGPATPTITNCIMWGDMPHRPVRRSMRGWIRPWSPTPMCREDGPVPGTSTNFPYSSAQEIITSAPCLSASMPGQTRGYMRTSTAMSGLRTGDSTWERTSMADRASLQMNMFQPMKETGSDGSCMTPIQH